MRFTLALCLLVASLPAFAAEPDPKQVDFFEKKIRPVLTQHCLKCHSDEAQKAGKLKGGLLLDSQKGWATGGDSGPAIVPGKPKESLLLKTMHYNTETQMPPAGKLADAVLKDFETWIAAGAADPRTGGGTKKQIGMTIEEGRKFWSYVPVAKPTVPTTKGTGTDIDKFILKKLEEKNLTLAAPVDRATLARRLYFDLIGLPPTPQQIDDFVQDKAANAVEKLVDKLLAMPEFGERWGRHWLDIARYAESVTLRGFIFKDAWRYRDYVIESFNKDVPYDRFIREQLAGDLLQYKTSDERTRNIVATTYLMLGNTNLEEQDKKQLRMDFVDEQLDVISKGLLAQTVTCARCHDHKFDPIPTKDYYALAGILRNVKTMEHSNVSAWTTVPLPVAANAEAELKKHEAKVAELVAKLAELKAKNPTPAASTVLAIKDIRGIVVDDTKAKKVGVWQDSTSNKVYIGDGYTHDQDKNKGEKTITFQPDLPKNGRYEVRFAYSPGSNRADKVPVTVFSADGEKTLDVNMQKTPPIEGRYISLGTFKFEKNGQSFVIVSNEGTKGHVTADAVVFIPEEAEKEKEQGGCTTEESPSPRLALLGDPLPQGERVNAFFFVPSPLVGEGPGVRANPKKEQQTPKDKPTDTVMSLEAELKKLQAVLQQRPVAMAPHEENKIEDCKVHIRGLVSNQGESVQRGVLQVAVQGKDLKFPNDQSGRLQLADWIASRENPLTARVMANRVWHWLFGSGIVRTVDNFGTTGEKPSHPELLDYLAGQFVQDGWSVKKLIRSIVLSKTYQQASVPDPKAEVVKADPENVLFGRFNRKRLEGEAIRDAMLSISGKLNPERGGMTFPATLSADYNFKSTELRRSVYLPHFRNALPELVEVFDAADPSMVTGKRNTSTVAPQALYLMNNPFVIEQAKQAALKLLAEKLADNNERTTRAYRITLGRDPTTGERAAIAKALAASKNESEAWSAVFHALFASAEFRYVK